MLFLLIVLQILWRSDPGAGPRLGPAVPARSLTPHHCSVGTQNSGGPVLLLPPAAEVPRRLKQWGLAAWHRTRSSEQDGTSAWYEWHVLFSATFLWVDLWVAPVTEPQDVTQPVPKPVTRCHFSPSVNIIQLHKFRSHLLWVFPESFQIIYPVLRPYRMLCAIWYFVVKGSHYTYTGAAFHVSCLQWHVQYYGCTWEKGKSQ
jgi:hypothetical protein